jgi:hypothetical protein
MSINDWKMQEEIQNDSRRITDSNIYGIKDYRVAKTLNSNYNFIVALKTIYEDLKLK